MKHCHRSFDLPLSIIAALNKIVIVNHITLKLKQNKNKKF